VWETHSVFQAPVGKRSFSTGAARINAAGRYRDAWARIFRLASAWLRDIGSLHG